MANHKNASDTQIMSSKLQDAIRIIQGVVDELDVSSPKGMNYGTNDYSGNSKAKGRIIVDNTPVKSGRQGADVSGYMVRHDTVSQDDVFSNSVQKVTPPHQEQNGTLSICFRVNGHIDRDPNNRERFLVDMDNSKKWLRLPNGTKGVNDGNSAPYVLYEMPQTVISSDSSTGCAILFLNSANPNETFEEYLEKRVNERIAQKELQRARKLEAENRKKAELEAKRKQEEEDKRIAEEQARVEAMSKYRTMEEVFNQVRRLRKDPTTPFLKLDSGMSNFSHTMYSENSDTPYVRCKDEQYGYIILPNKTSAFNINEIDDSVYECDSYFIDESYKLIQPCVVDEYNKIIQKGKISQ